MADLPKVTLSDGCRLNVKVLGDAPDKPLMIAHHGTPGMITHVEPEASFGGFADVFRVIVFDARGGGDSDRKGPYTHARWVEDIDELRQWAGADKFVLAGGSHGGFLALDYAVRYQQHLSGLIIGNAAAHIAGWGLLNALRIVLTDPRVVNPDGEQMVRVWSGEVQDMQELMSAFETVGALYGLPEELRPHVEVDPMPVMAAACTKPDVDTANAAHGHGLSRYDVRDDLPNIHVPTFVYTGRYDWNTPPRLSEEIARGLPNVRLMIYEKSAHFPGLEEKSKFQNDVRDWMKECSIHP